MEEPTPADKDEEVVDTGATPHEEVADTGAMARQTEEAGEEEDKIEEEVEEEEVEEEEVEEEVGTSCPTAPQVKKKNKMPQALVASGLLAQEVEGEAEPSTLAPPPPPPFPPSSSSAPPPAREGCLVANV